MKVRPPIDFKNKTIVIQYMLYFGDMVSLSPFLEVLRREAVGSKIILVMDARFKEAMANNPHVDELICVDRKKVGAIGNYKLGKEIGKEKVDILLTIHATMRTALMGWGMHPTFWCGESCNLVDRLGMDQIAVIETYKGHAAYKYLDFLESLGVKDLSHSGMKTYTSKEWEQKADDFLKDHHLEGKKLVGLSVGSSTPEKNWPAESYGKVADHFAEKGMISVFFGVKSELPLVEKALAAMKHKDKAVVAADKLSMGEFMALAGRCSLAFTNDSGPMYVMDSRGVPTIAMFGPSNAKFHYPMGKYSKALSSTDMPMEPEHLNKIIKSGKYNPIGNITVDEVIEAGEKALRDSLAN